VTSVEAGPGRSDDSRVSNPFRSFRPEAKDCFLDIRQVFLGILPAYFGGLRQGLPGNNVKLSFGQSFHLRRLPREKF